MKTITLTPWPIYPVRSGGQERCWNLTKYLNEPTVFSLDWTGESTHQRIEGVNYKTIGADPAAIAQAKLLMQSGVKTFDPMPMLTKKKLDTIRREIDNSDPDLIILEHPWLLDLTEGRPYIYDSHNCETLNTRQQFPHSLDTDLVSNLERRATQQAEHMTYTAEQDLKAMRQLYPFTTPVTHIPNGVTLPDTIATGEELTLIFIGSLYGPNIQAAKELISLAPLLNEYKIRILGNVCSVLETPYDNVELIGAVNDKQLDYYFRTAHAFINLTQTGSGTHLKIGRALAYGLPVITTPVGGRGYQTPLISNIANVPDNIRSLRRNWKQHSEQSRSEAELITWDIVGEKFRQVVNGLQ